MNWTNKTNQEFRRFSSLWLGINFFCMSQFLLSGNPTYKKEIEKFKTKIISNLKFFLFIVPGLNNGG